MGDWELHTNRNHLCMSVLQFPLQSLAFPISDGDHAIRGHYILFASEVLTGRFVFNVTHAGDGGFPGEKVVIRRRN
jgi:hypothetical protein